MAKSTALRLQSTSLVLDCAETEEVWVMLGDPYVYGDKIRVAAKKSLR
ncbi:MAG: hypothetical protein NWE92_04305 [Candidatus Bathyarchaeota archaeon]|nr:hypothetical protein [Candidatus Bathyarchaeota archaeon]